MICYSAYKSGPVSLYNPAKNTKFPQINKVVLLLTRGFLVPSGILTGVFLSFRPCITKVMPKISVTMLIIRLKMGSENMYLSFRYVQVLGISQ